MHIFRFLFIVVLLLPFQLHAQENVTSAIDFEVVFKNVRGAERKAVIEGATQVWTSGFMSVKEREEVTEIFNELQEMRMAVDPDLKYFVQILHAFYQRGEKENLWVWLKELKVNINAKEKRRTLVKDFLNISYGLVCENLLYKGNAHNWFVYGKYNWSHNPDLKINIEDAKVICKTGKDSIAIHQTDVFYSFNSNTLRGEKGIVYWQTEDSIYAELNRYTINMTVSDYTADSAYFNYHSHYKEPILGELKDNALKYTRTKNATYPRFSSYRTNIAIDSIFSGVYYEGGISYEGEKFFGFGNDKQPAYVYISPDDTMELYVYSKRFSVDSGRVMTGNSRIVLPIGGQELTHPNVTFSYTKKNNTVLIKRSSEQSLHTPFRDDYHQILLGVEELSWPLDCCYMSMNMTSRSGLFKASVESLNFFNDIIYDDMQGLDETHPLNALYNTSKKVNDNTFSLSEHAEIQKKPINQLRQQVVLLSYNDFVEFDEKNDQVTLKPRLFDYVQARLARKDYDNIKFISHPQDSRINAILNLKSHSLKIFGVDRFTLSEAKDVYVEPSDKVVVMHKNRDMEFNGKLKAGFFDMYGHNLFFSYENYEVELTKVDSTSMYIADPVSRKRGAKLNSLIRDMTGNIVIDKPDNKSGKKHNPGYPILNSTSESFVYYDKILQGEYKRDSFYFVIKPYTIRNINDGEGFRYSFNGTLISNILPDINDSLVLMKDLSLGMNYTTPDEGLALYRRGNLVSKFVLNQQGLIADGSVDLNNSNFKSPSITLMPDSMMSVTQSFVAENIAGQRPGARGEDIAIKYVQKDRVIRANTTRKPFSVYDKRVTHTGSLFVYNELMDASGMLELKGAKLSSTLFNLKANNIESKSADLQLSSFSNKNIQLNTADVLANIDLIANTGKFVNNTDANMADFPANRFKCSFKSFTWYMEEAFLNIGIEDPNELARIWKIEDDSQIPEQGKNIFIATAREADSLSFIAPLAKYSLTTGDISCMWVNHIDIANGRFYPNNGDVFISNVGDIREFTHSVLLCERSIRNRKLNEVDLKLRGRYTFNGSGDFDYINQEKQRTVIRFTKIGVDTARNLYSSVNMAQEAEFKLNAGITYKGEITLLSKLPDLFFNGSVRLTADDKYLKQSWLKVKTFFKASDIRVPVDIENRDDKGNRLFNGIFLNVDRTIRPYATYTSSRLFYDDNMILGGKGELVWLGDEKRYTIKDLSTNPYYYFDYIPDQNTVSGFGQLATNMDIPGITQHMVGNISYNLEKEDLKIDNALYRLELILLSKMQGAIVKDFTHKRLKRIEPDSSLMEKLSIIYNPLFMAALHKQMNKNSNNVPDSLECLLTLDSLAMGWDKKNRSYVYNGEVYVRSVMKKPVDEMYNVMLEFIPRRSGNQLFIYLYKDDLWYYFEYVNKSLFTLSSNGEYNGIVRNEKADKKIIQNKLKETLYTITLCPDSKKNRFVKRMATVEGDVAQE